MVNGIVGFVKMIMRRFFQFFLIYSSIFLILLGNSPGLFALDPEKPMGKLLLDEWKKAPCMNYLSINSMAQTFDGFMWFGTRMGLIRFDGREFKFFDLKKILKVKKKNVNFISRLLVDKSGTMWISVDHGLVEFRDGQFKMYSRADGLVGNYIMDIYEDMKGALWLGTLDNYLNRYQAGKFEYFGRESGLLGNYVTAIREDDKGDIWIATFGNGLFKLQQNRLENQVIPGMDENICIQAMIRDRKGFLWLGTKRGLIQMKDRLVRYFASSDGLWDDNIISLLEDNDGNIWVGSSKGLNRIVFGLSGESFIEGTLPDTYVRCLFEDRENNIWIGTQGDGIKRLKNTLFYTLAEADGLPDQISTLFAEKNGKVWVGTGLGELFEFYNGAFSKINTKDNLLKGSRVSAINMDLQGNLWIGSYGSGLFILQDNKLIPQLSRQDLNGSAIIALAPDGKGGIYVGTSNQGVLYFFKGRFVRLTNDSGLLSNKIYGLLVDSRQNCWVGTDNGLNYFPNGDFGKDSVKKFFPGTEITNFYEDSRHHVWITTIDGGQIIAKKGQFLNLSMDQGLYSNVHYAVLEDLQGNYWLSCDAGVIRIRQAAFRNFVSGKIQSVDCTLFDLTDGIKNREFSWFSTYNGVKTGSGELWFATNKGIAVADPAEVKINPFVPQVLLEEIYINGKRVSQGKKNNVFTRVIDITFNITAPTFGSPGKLRFKYTLEKGEEQAESSQVTKDRTVSYHNLAPGEYILSVQARNRDGIWGRDPLTYSFSVKPLWTETPTFTIILSTLVIVFVVIFLHWVKMVFTQNLKIKKYRDSVVHSKEALRIKLKLINLLEIEKIHLNNDVSLKYLAQKLGTSPRFLSQVINVHFNKNFWDLINSYRIENAKKLLVKTDTNNNTILGVAFDLGYNSKEVFNRAFKKHTGMTPTQFKRKSKGS